MSRTLPQPFIVFAETCAFIGLLYLTYFATGGVERIGLASPHPFWIVVVVMSIHRGLAGAITSAALASFLFLVTYSVEMGLDQTYQAYQAQKMGLPALWLAVGCVIGALRNTQVARLQNVERELEISRANNAVLKKGYDQLEASTIDLQKRIASDRQTLTALLKIQPVLQYKDLEQRIEALLPFIATSVKADDISFYKSHRGELIWAAGRGSISHAQARTIPLRSDLPRHLPGALHVSTLKDADGRMAGAIVLHSLEPSAEVDDSFMTLDLLALELGHHSEPETLRLDGERLVRHSA